MMVLELLLTERQVEETQRKARALRERLPANGPKDKIEVDAGTLMSFLTFVTEARTRRIRERRVVVQQPVEAVDDEISPQEAADILKMSRPSVMRLIAKGHLHPRKVLSRNKLSRAEVLDYQRQNTRQQRQALSNLSALSEQYGF